jgi:hypothetical protein
MVNFKNLNENPMDRKTGDCVIRALTSATGMNYNDVYRELFDISLKTGYILNEKRVYEKFLTAHGFTKIKQPKHCDGTKYLIGEIDLLAPRKGICVISCAHHLTCYRNGFVVDTWDCRGKTIGNYYVKGGEW